MTIRSAMIPTKKRLLKNNSSKTVRLMIKRCATMISKRRKILEKGRKSQWTDHWTIKRCAMMLTKKKMMKICSSKNRWTMIKLCATMSSRKIVKRHKIHYESKAMMTKRCAMTKKNIICSKTRRLMIKRCATMSIRRRIQVQPIQSREKRNMVQLLPLP